MLGRRSFSKACEEAAHQIAQCAVECDVLLEVNLKGRKSGKKPYAQGVYGYDAHVPVDLLDERAIDECNKLIEGLNLTFADEFKIK